MESTGGLAQEEVILGYKGTEVVSVHGVVISCKEANLYHSITSFGDRPNTYEEVSEYFRAHFLQVHRRNVTSRRVLYTVRAGRPSSWDAGGLTPEQHFTSVIDTKATQTIIVNVADSIMRDYFAEARLV